MAEIQDTVLKLVAVEITKHNQFSPLFQTDAQQYRPESGPLQYIMAHLTYSGIEEDLAAPWDQIVLTWL